jgi:monothiol glutaredoxin
MIYGSAHIPLGPRSALAVWLMESAGIHYQVVDVLADPAFRAEALRRSGLSLFPQLYIDGEFIGSGEVIAELRASGFFQQISSVGQAGSSEA